MRPIGSAGRRKTEYEHKFDEPRGVRRTSPGDQRKWERIRREGRAARSHGRQRTTNPHLRGGDEWSAWDMGWMEAG